MAPSDLPDVIMENGLQPDVTSSDKHALRRIALAEVDNAPLGLSHLRAVVVAGTGFFTDAYDLFSANFITTMIGLAFYKSHVIPTSVDTAIKLSTTAGAVLGQVVFGWLADKLGRKRMYGIELIIIIAGSFGQAISGSGPGMNLLGPLIFWRVFMGVGVGGDYPLSSVITSEFATVKWRGALMNSVFAMYVKPHSFWYYANSRTQGKGSETLLQQWSRSSAWWHLKGHSSKQATPLNATQGVR